MRQREPDRPVFGIRYKIILCIYLVLIPVLLLSCAVIYYSSYVNTMEVTVRQHESAIQSVDENIGYLERDLLDISTYISVNSSIADVLSSEPEETAADPLFWKRQAPISVLQDMLAVKNHIRSLVIYPENGLPSFYITRDKSVHHPNIDTIRDLPLYQRAVAAQGANIWESVPMGDTGLFEKNTSDKVVVCRELFDLAKRTRLGFLVISMDRQSYEAACASALLGSGDGIAIISQWDGQVIAQAGQVDAEVLGHLQAQDVILPDEAAKTPYQYMGYYIFGRQHENSGDWIYYLSPKGNWDAWIRSGLIMPLVLGIALLVCIWPLSRLASRIITRPLSLLYSSMNKFKEGDFDQQVEVVGNDEIANLTATFNHMVRDLRELIDRNYVMVLREKESELNALQAQINPHFLYNALDSLYWQATDNGQDDLAEDILALSELFRLLLSSGKSEVTVDQEVRIITRYLHIQKMRFARRLDFSIDIQPEMQELPISKLVLQPFVENAIVHGLEKKDTNGFVKVSGFLEDGFMHFTIEDNGTGMPPETVEEILFAQEDKRYANQRIGRYAIRNVKERLALRYGGRAKLSIESEVDRGTTVHIMIPLEERISGEILS